MFVKREVPVYSFKNACILLYHKPFSVALGLSVGEIKIPRALS